MKNRHTLKTLSKTDPLIPTPIIIDDLITFGYVLMDTHKSMLEDEESFEKDEIEFSENTLGLIGVSVARLATQAILIQFLGLGLLVTNIAWIAREIYFMVQ